MKITHIKTGAIYCLLEEEDKAYLNGKFTVKQLLKVARELNKNNNFKGN